MGVQVIVDATFSEGFQQFLQKEYGHEVAETLIRPDLGVNGSFGGGPSSVSMKLKRDPVVIVHGINSNCGIHKNFSDFAVARGFEEGSLFAMSYGPNGTNMNVQETLKCDYIKRVRQLLMAVRKYTGRKLVVVGVSLGSPVSRKVGSFGGRPSRKRMFRQSSEGIVLIPTSISENR